MGNERLRAQRRIRGWSQEDVVRGLVQVGIEIGERQLGVTRHLVSRWERGVTSPRAPYPKLLCLLFQASAEELGLVSPSSPSSTYVTIGKETIEEDDVERRRFLHFLGTAAAGTLLPSSIWPTLSEGTLQEMISITGSYRRLSPTVPSSTLLSVMIAHLRVLRELLDSARSGTAQARVCAAATEAAAFAGRLAFDLGDYPLFQRHYRSAIQYAERSGDQLLHAYTMASLGYWSGYWSVEAQEEGEKAMHLVRQAQSLLPDHVPRIVEAWIAMFGAVAHSRIGDASRTFIALGRAEEAIGRYDEPWPWAVPLDVGKLSRHRGYSATRLGRPDMSIPALQEGLAALGPSPSKWRALTLADLAESYVLTDEVEEACNQLNEAFTIGIDLRSDRVVKRVAKVRTQLTPWKDAQAVRELGERMVEGLMGGL